MGKTVWIEERLSLRRAVTVGDIEVLRFSITSTSFITERSCKKGSRFLESAAKQKLFREKVLSKSFKYACRFAANSYDFVVLYDVLRCKCYRFVVGVSLG